MESLIAYLPMDRRQALYLDQPLPERMRGAALFADISGFTPLTEALVHELGPRRGAEELSRHLNKVFDALIAELHRNRGSVIGFSGDAITCWLDEDNGLRAVDCALAMQAAMSRFANVTIPSGRTITLAMKVAISSGAVRRFLVGDPQVQVIEAMTGDTLDSLAVGEHLAQKGEIIVDRATLKELGSRAVVAEWRQDADSGMDYGVVQSLAIVVAPQPWETLPTDALSDERLRPWILEPVYDRLCRGQGDFLAELRPAVSLFLRFTGIDFEGDEEAGQKLDRFVRTVQNVLTQYEGYLIQLTIGDKGSYLYAAFGAPTAHEDDVVRAANTALDLRNTVGGLEFIDEIQIGISAGQMITGAYGGRMRRTYGVLGDEVNLAARLMQAAAPGEILISAAAQQQAAQSFRWLEHPPLKVKGKSKPITIYSLQSRRERSTIRLQEPKYALPMVGRVKELNLIQDKLETTLGGKGQILGIQGEAGIGKSRLIAETVRLANENQMLGLGGECQSYGTNISYLVWQNIWQSFFGLESGLSTSEILGSVQEQLHEINPQLVPRLPLLSSVLNLSIPDNELTSSFDAKLRKASLESLLIECLRARARQTPMMLVLENCHWLDPLSHELLETIGRAIADLPVLLVMAYRPPDVSRLQAPKVSLLGHFSEIDLHEFTSMEAEQLIQLKLKSFIDDEMTPSATLIEHITRRAEGNPFYIEELISYLKDQEINPARITSLDEIDLPTSLQSLILSRIDQRTDSQKITLRVASIIGRMFIAAWLWGAFPQLGDESQIRDDLRVLSQLDLTPLDMPEPELTYLFKHIVTQEVAYESLPFATRSILHEQLAGFIEETSPETNEQHIYLLAHHYERTDNEAKKREYLFKAGKAAQASFANEAAINYFQQAEKLYPDEEKSQVLSQLGQVLSLVGRWQEADKVYRQALDLARRLNDWQSEGSCQSAISQLLGRQGHYTDAAEWLDDARATFEAHGDRSGVGQVLHFAGTLAAQQGRFAEASEIYQQSLEIRREFGQRKEISDLLNNLGIVARQQGDRAKARRLQEEALAIRRELGNKSAIAVSLVNLGNLALDQDDFEEARNRLEEAILLQREVGDRFYIANALNNLGNVYRDQGMNSKAWDLYKESLEINRDLGAKWAIAYLLEDIGCLAASQNSPVRALQLVGAASKLRQEIGARLSAQETEKLESMLAPTRQALTKDEQEAAHARGAALTLDEAIGEALNGNL